jgi:hypothetical protein
MQLWSKATQGKHACKAQGSVQGPVRATLDPWHATLDPYAALDYPGPVHAALGCPGPVHAALDYPGPVHAALGYPGPVHAALDYPGPVCATQGQVPKEEHNLAAPTLEHVCERSGSIEF